MTVICTRAAQCSARLARSSTSSPLRRSSTTALSQRHRPAPARRWQSTDAAASSNPKIAEIVDQIGRLNLLETADLVSSLKTRLNIPDLPTASFAAGPAGPAAAPVEEDDAPPAEAEKTLFNLKLQSFEGGSKPKIIKEIKSMLGLSLVDSKKFVESAPKVMREGVPKEEAEKIVEALKALGGVVVME
ncbi:MAG: hypothetical protein M1817_001328 [Caeruleum heppii]|nr:MAG: hypothetical protein M1817_001328 [Caeruleum heppii]